MAKYFLHVHNGDGLQTDDVGHEFSTAALAVAQAASTAGGIISDETAESLENRAVRIVVKDEAGSTVAEITMNVSKP